MNLRLWLALLCVLHLTGGRLESSPDPLVNLDIRSNPQLCARMLESLQGALMGDEKTPVERLQNDFGLNVNDPSIPFGFHQFESEIYAYFVTLSPELRDSEDFKRRWNLTSEQMLDVLLYYASEIFEKDLNFVSQDPLKAFERLLELSRTHYLKHEGAEILSRHAFYERSLTQKSVPQMAAHLEIPESQVYRELGILKLSILKAFSQAAPAEARDKAGLAQEASLLEVASKLLESGEALDAVARQLSVGSEALQFALHATHIQSRRVDWNRSCAYEGQPISEENLAMLLRDSGYTNAQIADRLNQIFSSVEGVAGFRTESSVNKKLQGLMGSTYSWGSQNIFHEKFGYLKRSGRLVSVNLIRYLFEHWQSSDEELAKLLEIQLESLKQFYHRNGISRGDGGFRFDAKTGKFKIIHRYEEQMMALDLVMRWMRENNLRLPLTSDFGYGPGKIELSLPKLVSTSNYRNPPKRHPELIYGGTFPSPLDFFVALKKRAAHEGIEVWLIDVATHQVPSDLHQRIMQEEAFERVLRWMRNHAMRRPMRAEFGKGKDRVGLRYSRLIASDQYAEGQPQYIHRVFDSAQDFWGGLEAYLSQRGIQQKK